jgi:hypothetical protein
VLSVSYLIEHDELLVVLENEQIQETEAELYAGSYRERGWKLIGVIADK